MLWICSVLKILNFAGWKIIFLMQVQWFDKKHSSVQSRFYSRLLFDPLSWGQTDHHLFSNFSCWFLNPINFSHLNCNCSNLLNLKNHQEQFKKHSVTKNGYDLYPLNNVFWWSQKFCKFLAFSLEFQKLFSINRTFFSHSRSEQFW